LLHALLIDDDALARTDLRGKLAAHGGVGVVGEASTLRTARALFTEADYDVVFLDVHLIGGMSFQLVPLLRPGASVIFATAHEHYALQAFEVHAVDYLVKPIDPGRLADALRRAVANRREKSPSIRPGPVSFLDAVPAQPAAPPPAAEVVLTREERAFLRRMLEVWEDALPSDHVLRQQPAQARQVVYDRTAMTSRIFLNGAHTSPLHRGWSALRRLLLP
jgi:two-component system LytT family response regulator